MKDLYTIYNIEADDFIEPLPPKRPFGVVVLKAVAVFLVITAVVFLISNYQGLKNRYLDWREEGRFVKIKDNDLDGMDDEWEKRFGFSTKESKDAAQDADSDFLSNRREFYFGANPRKADSDGDGYYDNEEIIMGFNPMGVGRIDSDEDGLYDWWENLFGLNKKDPDDASKDLDEDGLDNLQEFKYRTHPKVDDSDFDGFKDGDEVGRGFNPAGSGKLKDASWITNGKDTDNDGLENVFEDFFGSDISRSDSDSDGVSDRNEFLKGSNPLGDGIIVVILEIPSLEISMPINWVDIKDKEMFLKGMGEGAIFYPGRDFPGSRGNAYIFGSSGSYRKEGKKIYGEFKKLPKIEENRLIKFKIKLGDEEEKEIVYKVEFVQEVSKGDLRIERGFEGHELTLATATSSRKVFMVKASLFKPRWR